MRDISCAGIAVKNPTGAAFVAAPVIFSDIRLGSAGGDIAARLRRLGEKRHEARRCVKAAVGGDGALERGDVVRRGEHAHAVQQLWQHRHVLPGELRLLLQDGVRAHDRAHAQPRSGQIRAQVLCQRDDRIRARGRIIAP